MTSMQSLQIFAGSQALKDIQTNGFKPSMFSAFLGASGGPKWFSLAGLDKVIFPEFFADHSHHIDILGSSAGAFRAACLAQNDPKAAIERLAQRYSNTVYSAKPTSHEITQKGFELLYYVLGENGIEEILQADNKTVHFFVAQCHGLVASPSSKKQLLGLARAGMRNLMARRKLNKHFTRTVFSSQIKTGLFDDPECFDTDILALQHNNLVPALMASGSIPMVLDGIENIAGAPPGMYRDGGIIDYHFDLRINTQGLVLYPHFYKTPTPGWFDKSLRSRQCHASSYDNVVMLVPSDEFVASLPYQKIPDRKDFEDMPAPQRIAYWEQVIAETDRLGDEFLSMVQDQSIVEQVQSIDLRRN